MVEQPRETIRDPKALRALAHPTRWKLLDLLGSEGTATATRCAEVLGESVASCSYHLNMLAKYQFIEHATGSRGREKPWRLTSSHQSWSSEGMDVEGALAAEAATEAFLDFQFAQMKARARSHSTEPDDWRKATGFDSASPFLTAVEAQQLQQDLRALIARYEGRIDHPETRPEGARQVRFFVSALVTPRTPATD